MQKNPLTVVRSKAALASVLCNVRYRWQTISLVPTMGALHNGHLSLVSLSREFANVTVASIFVNPTQFAPGEDFDSYPRNEQSDLEQLEAAGCDVAYLPMPEEIYPAGSVTDVRVPGLSDKLDGIHRPHFFYGVTTVVSRLFLHVQPDFAVFGEKDFQQLQIIRRMVCDLGFPIEILAGPTLRDPDGLAQSSRNLYLSSDERAQARALFESLSEAQTALQQTNEPLSEILRFAENKVLQSGFDSVDYISAVDPDTLEALGPDRTNWPGQGRILGAAWMGRTRLIDNLALDFSAEKTFTTPSRP